MARCRCNKVLLMVVHFTSFITISFLIRENLILKQTIDQIHTSATYQMKKAVVNHTRNINPINFPSKSQLRNRRYLKQKERATASIISRRFHVERPTRNLKSKEATTKAGNTIRTKLKRDTKNDTASFIKHTLPPSHGKPRRFIPSKLTIVVLKPSMNHSEDATKTLNSIRRLYPTAQLLLHKNDKTETLNTMISRVKTEYFLVLEEGVMFSGLYEESIELLWDALERFPEIDFIGGSYLAGEKLYVACHHYRHCNWTFSVSYEYERSIGNIMICDGTSSSFMGRRESVEKIKGFDSNIPHMLILTDFFFRAKANRDIVIGTLPNVMFLVDHFSNLYQLWQSKDTTKDLLPFAVKHKIFIFKDSDGNTIDLCSPTSPLSGKDICNEEIAHKVMLDGAHWSYSGVFTYPYMLSYLEITLSEVTKFFEEHNVNYVVIGGVMLGAIKMRSILPWEAGDIDIRVYGMSLVQLLELIEPWGIKNGYLVRTYESEAVHIFCTPQEVGRVSGGLATIYPYRWKTPPDFIKIKTNGIWVRYERKFAKFFNEHYGNDFLQHKVYRRKETIQCKIKEHNACLPNFKSLHNGKAGSVKEYYCQT